MKVILLFLMVFSLKSFGSVSVDMKYSQAVDVFEILDHLSMWHPNSLKQYREYWVANIGLTEKDKNLLDKYVQIRKKYAKNVGSVDRLDLFFSPAIAPSDLVIDAISDAFYTQKTIDDAIRVLQNRVTLEEIKFFTVFYKHFKQSLESVLKESVLLDSMAKKTRDSHVKGKLDAVANAAGTFFDIDSKSKISLVAYFVWYPPEKDLLISHIGTNTMIRINPMAHTDRLNGNEINYELAKRIGMFQSSFQKEAITKRIIDSCESAGLGERLDFLEKPLALIIGRLLVDDKIEKGKANIYQILDKSEVINLRTIALYNSVFESIKNKATIKDRFLADTILLCRLMNPPVEKDLKNETNISN